MDTNLRLKSPRHSLLPHLGQHQPTHPFTPPTNKNNRWTVLGVVPVSAAARRWKLRMLGLQICKVMQWHRGCGLLALECLVHAVLSTS